MNKSNTPRRRLPMKARAGAYHGYGTLLSFAECQGIIVARTLGDLRVLARGLYLADFDPTKARKVKVAKDGK